MIVSPLIFVIFTFMKAEAKVRILSLRKGVIRSNTARLRGRGLVFALLQREHFAKGFLVSCC